MPRAVSMDSPRSVNETEEEWLKVVGDYKHGSITRIKLIKFLTYSEVEVSPKPRLNMVVGPNGTGKSSILCAVCLGLGGEPRLLGRASEVETFIQNGQDEGYIELELANERGTNPVITRTIRKGGGKKSTFTWNGDAISGKKVREKVAQEFQIQIDNLCTFLPQEKVGNFSGFDSKALLLETEKTLSANKELYENHLKLITLQEELHGGDDQVESLEQKLEQLKVELKRMEREVQRMEQLQQDEVLKDLLEKKILWLKFDQLRDEFATLKDEKEELKKKLLEAREEIAPLQQAHEEATQKMNDSRKEFDTFEKEIKLHKKEMDKQKQKYENHDDSIEETLGELHTLETARAQLERRVEEARDKVKELQNALDTRPASLEDLEAEKDRLVAEHKPLHPQYQAKRKECEKLEPKVREADEEINHAKRKLSKLKDEKSNRMRNFFTKEQDVKKAYEWIHSNRTAFRKEVLGPIACEVTPKSNNAAAYLEQHVPNATLRSFVVQERSDYDLLYQKVRVEQNCPINIIVIDRLPQPKPRMYSEEKMSVLKRDHGVVGYLDESFEAPAVVMEALRSVASIDKVLVGTDKTQSSMDDRGLGEFLSQSERGDGKLTGYCIFTSDRGKSYKYTAQLSKYSGKSNMRVDDILPARLLTTGVSEERKAQVERELKERKIEFEELLPAFQKAKEELEDIKRRSQEAQAQIKDVKGQITLTQKTINKLNTSKRKLKELEEKLGVDDEDDKQRKIDQLNQRIRNSLKALNAHSASYKKMLAATVSASGARLCKEAAVVEERHCREKFEEKAGEVRKIEQEFTGLRQKMTQKKAQAKQAQQAAMEKAPLEDEEGNELPLKEKVEVDLAQYDTVDLAEAAWEEVEQKIRNTVADRNVICHYKNKQTEVEITQDQLDAMTKNKEGKRADMARISEPWEESLELLLGKVDSRFSRYMSELGCVGEVKLRKGSGKDDEEEPRFEDYGVEIRVSFREGVKPSVLSARVQSGGERSVSTIMYLMAMQDLMVAPFRCVDEINQGLDERNERLVFKRIVENSTKPPGRKGPTDHCGQYWLITPKLLPNLTDMEVEALNVLCIFNGPYNLKRPSDWDVENIVGLRKRARLEAEENEEE